MGFNVYTSVNMKTNSFFPHLASRGHHVGKSNFNSIEQNDDTSRFIAVNLL